MNCSPASNMDVKKANRNRIYRIIHANHGISRPEIAAQLQMSLPTVMSNVKLLMEQGVVNECGSLESTGGRKATALSGVPDARLAVGLDITFGHVVAVLVDLSGKVVASKRKKLNFALGDKYVDRVGGMVDDLLEASAIDRKRIIGTGVSIPGVLSASGDMLTTSHVLRTDNYSFAPLNKRLGMPCLYCNDANAAGIAEMWGADPSWHFVYMSLSNSVGGALVWEGAPRLGDNRRCGELGHMTIQRGGLRCYCGKKGCLDSYCSAALLSEKTGGSLGEFFRRLDEGDVKLRAAWDDYLDYLATAVNTLRMIIDYDIVIGGYIGAYMDKYVDDLRRRAAGLNTFDESGEYIKVCRHKEESSAVGAALQHIHAFINTI